MRAGVAISSIGHAVVLGWGLLAFAPAAFDTPPAESMPVDLVPITDLTQLQAGNKDAPKKEEAKQTGEKKEEPKRAPEAEQKPKQPEVKQAAAPPEAKPEPKPEPKKEEPKPEPKKEAAAPMPPKREAPPKPQAAKAKQRDFNPDQIAALLDKRQPNMARASEAPAPTGAFGASTGNAPSVSLWWAQALEQKVQSCWNVLATAGNAEVAEVRLLLKFKPDGTLAALPVVLDPQRNTAFQIIAESAIRAVIQCQPYTMLPQASYDMWKEIDARFRLPGISSQPRG